MAHKNKIEINGKFYFSVTSITGQIRSIGLEIWRGKVGNTIANKASKEGREQGTKIHDLLNKINQGQQVDKSPLSKYEINVIEGYEKWFDENVADIKIMEKDLISHKYLFHGKSDMIFKSKITKERILADFKTSNYRNKETELKDRLQLSAYAIVARENGFETDRRIIFYMPDGFYEPETLPPDEYGKDEKIFLAQNKVYRYFNL